MDQNSGKRHSFILRIWREAGFREWKGWIQHARSGESTNIQTSTDLLSFIDKYKGDDSSLKGHDEAITPSDKGRNGLH